MCFSRCLFLFGDYVNLKKKYVSSAFLLLLSSIIVKFIGAVYKIPLTTYIGAVGRGYFAYAYNLVMPVYIVTMGAFPVALSKLVSSYLSKNDSSRVEELKKASKKLFFLIGLACTLILLAFSKLYCDYVVGAPMGIYTCVALAPSVLLSCMGCAYRGYFEGMLDMKPTAISQTLEALFKMIFGLLFAKYVTSSLLLEFDSSHTVLGNPANDLDTALSMIYPLSSAGAMLGVTLGSFASLCFLWVYSLIFGKSGIENKYKNKNTFSATKELLFFSFPIMISTGVQSVFQFLDTASIQYSLDKVETDLLKNHISQALVLCNVTDDDLPTYAFGLLSSALDFKNLVPGITMALGICAVPVISRAFEEKNIERLTTLAESIIKYTSLLSCLGGLILRVCSNDILSLFYSDSSPDIVVGCKNLVSAFAISVPVYSIAGTAVFFVQSIGLAKKSILPYAACGIIRVGLNIILIKFMDIVLFAPVISGAVGYFVLAFWNITVFSKNTKTDLNYLKIVLAPILIFAVCLFVSYFVFNSIYLGDNLLICIIAKTLLCSVFYLILSFLCGLLKIKDIFCYFLIKKMPDTLANTE